ncbi:MAG: 1,4-alpha-glucan branching protein GlgB [Clostridiales bacterium]|nr:1,4-alpha-glucan branching protein GlgB [Clostridiales bacterium]
MKTTHPKNFIDPNLLYLFNQGSYYHAYNTFGAHLVKEGRKSGVRFTVWAPGVRSVSVAGDHNDWAHNADYLTPIGTTGVWSGFVPGVAEGQRYKYRIETAAGQILMKADPFAFQAELRPETASVVRSLDYEWKDARWMEKRAKTDHFSQPKNIYEVHLGSWKQHPVDSDDPGDPRRFYTYRQLAKTLIPYVKEMGYTHIELLPVMEHPFDGSWGYQLTGFFAATSRYGDPTDLMYLIDCAHKAGIGVILDWVPGHFCRDAHGLGRFTGQMLYEGDDHQQWGTYKFNFNRSEVRSFLLSSAMFWLEKYHADGIRVDGVTSMLYLNFGKNEGEPKRQNIYGGDGDLDAISFLQEFNGMVGRYFPGVFTAAEESTSWPLVTAPPEAGGLGFHYKWDMGWMNDTLKYMSTDFPYRPGCHSMLTFSMMYAFNENFILPLSHDEVVHGKLSLIGRMPGDYWRKFAGLRLLALYQTTHPGGMLNFMGNEIGQFIEWRYYEGIEWFLLGYDHHARHQAFIKDLNKVYKKEKSLWDCDHSWNGFQWIDANNAEQGVLSYIRTSASGRITTVTLLNCDVRAYEKYRIGVPLPGRYEELINSDAAAYGGSGKVNSEAVQAEAIPAHGMPYSVEVTVPPIGGMILKRISK